MDIKGIARKHKKFLISLLLFLIVPTIVNFLVVSHHPKMRVGIVLVDDCNLSYAEDAKDGFQYHNDYFSAKIIEDYRLNSSYIRVKYELLLTTDFFNKTRTEELCEKYDTDVILYITDKRIHNWDDPGGGAWWGQANLESSSAVMTIACFQNDTSYEISRRKGTAVHEIGHLAGFIHPPKPQTLDDIMIYADPYATLNFSSYYDFTMPFHLTVYKLGHGYRFGSGDDGPGHNMLFIKMLADLFFLPYIIGLSALMFHSVNLLNGLERIHKTAIGITAAFGYLTYTIVVFHFAAIVHVIVFMALFTMFYHLSMRIMKMGKDMTGKKKKERNDETVFTKNY